jgi:Flp pilus assembly protein TadB
MRHQMLIAATLLAATNSNHFHVGPWTIVPILILIAIIGSPIYVIRDRRKRRYNQRTR